MPLAQHILRMTSHGCLIPFPLRSHASHGPPSPAGSTLISDFLFTPCKYHVHPSFTSGLEYPSWPSLVT